MDYTACMDEKDDFGYLIINELEIHGLACGDTLAELSNGKGDDEDE